jgi:hypothetical protein
MQRVCALAFVAVLPGLLVADEKKDEKSPVVRALDVKATSPASGKATQPLAIRSADELSKAVSDEAAVAAVKKLVDFETEQVVYFAWSGSGQDRITVAAAAGTKGPEVKFTYAAGRTRDFRPHRLFFALPKNATYKVIVADR